MAEAEDTCGMSYNLPQMGFVMTIAYLPETMSMNVVVHLIVHNATIHMNRITRADQLALDDTLAVRVICSLACEAVTAVG